MKPLKQPSRSSVPAKLSKGDLAVSKHNMKRALKAYSEDGPEGLNKVLDELFPGTKAREL